MATKDISDAQVCAAVAVYQTRMGLKRIGDNTQEVSFPNELLAETTGQPDKVCLRAMERACSRGLIEYGVSLRTGWLTEAGKRLLADALGTTPTTPQEPPVGDAS